MVCVLGHQHLRQQPSGGDAFVDDVRIDGYLVDGLALRAGPLAPDVALDTEDAQHVVQLLGHVLADALHLAATLAQSGLGLVADLAPRQVCGQRRALGHLLLFRLGRSLRFLQRIDLRGHGRQVGLNLVLEQALLLGVELLALRGELQPLQDRVLVRELLDDGLLERRLCARCTQQFAQLLGVEGFEVIGDHEE